MGQESVYDTPDGEVWSTCWPTWRQVLLPAAHAPSMSRTPFTSQAAQSAAQAAAIALCSWSEKGVRLAQKMQVVPCIPVGMQL